MLGSWRAPVLWTGSYGQLDCVCIVTGCTFRLPSWVGSYCLESKPLTCAATWLLACVSMTGLYMGCDCLLCEHALVHTDSAHMRFLFVCASNVVSFVQCVGLWVWRWLLHVKGITFTSN